MHALDGTQGEKSLLSIADWLKINACFAAGTPLLTPTGPKNIEDFQVGDELLSRSEYASDGSLETKRVERVFVRFAAILNLHIGGEVIRTTHEHPFYAQGKGWVNAQDLQIGDQLLCADGRWLCVEDLLDTGEWEQVYNLTIADIHKVSRMGFLLDHDKERSLAGDYAKKLRIKCESPRQLAGRLSGGNQQKSLLARWLFANTQVFLLDEPTRGVDVAARSEIYREVNELAEAGACIVMVSSDLPELLGMADRILVMRRGKLVAELDAKQTTQEEILKHAALEE